MTQPPVATQKGPQRVRKTIPLSAADLFDGKISDRAVAALGCPPGRKDALFFDTDLKGFGVRVTGKGAKLFLLQYTLGGVRRRLPLGEFPAMTAAKARSAAEVARGVVKGGGDPWGARKAAELAAREREAALRAKAAEQVFTFKRLLDAWKEKGLAHRRARYADDAFKRLTAYFATWTERPASSITRTEAMQAIDRLETERGTISARRALAYTRACYGWAVKRNLLDENPFRGLAAPGRENPRDRVLTDIEIGEVWRASEELTPVYTAFVRILLLTLQRREEVAGMRWGEISPDLKTWLIPAERAKNGRAHVVHLNQATQGILATVPRFKSIDVVFVGRGGGSISGFSHSRAQLDAAIAKERAEAGVAASTMLPWRFHDFRRTGVTALAGMGFAPHVCDRLLNHITGAIQGVAAVYQRAEFLKEREAALNAWAEHVLRCASGAAAQPNVVTLASHGKTRWA